MSAGRERMRVKILFVLIFLLAGLLRFYKLVDFPPSLNWDEVSHGYNAYSILETGKDQWGVSWPIFNFRAYGDYPMILNLYLTIPAVSIFGLNEFSVRLPSALLGTLTVVLCYFLGKILFKRYLWALFFMFLVAIAPWTILPSRAVFQSTVAQFFLIGGITAFFYAIFRKKLLFWFICCISLAVSAYGYHNTRIVVPLIFSFLVFIFRKDIFDLFKKSPKIFLLSFFIFISLTALQLYNLTSPESRARSKWVFLIDDGVVNQINNERLNFSGTPLLGKIIFNKVTYFVPHFIGNYLLYLDPRPLFFFGGTQYQFSVQNRGVLFPIWLPFFYLGLFLTIKKSIKKDRLSLFLLYWLAVGLLPAALTKDSFQVIRSFSAIPVHLIMITLGVVQTAHFLRVHGLSTRVAKFAFLLLVIGSLAFLANYIQEFFGNYRVNYSWSWQYGYKDVVGYAHKNYTRYDRIIITKKYGEPHEFLLFWWPWDPKSYQEGKEWDYHANWYWINKFDKFEFMNDWEIVDQIKDQQSKAKTLLVTSPKNYPEGWKVIKTINFLDGKTAFEILTNQE